MILPQNSYLRNPPLILHSEQVVIFNAIRYSIDICEVSYDRLIKNISELTEKENIQPLDFPTIFSDVWSIINNSVLFIKIITEHFKIERNEPKLTELNKAINLRHSNQHITERISQILSTKDLPIYGYLSWTKTYSNSNEEIIATIYSGTFSNKGNVKIEISNKNEENKNTNIEKLEFTNIVREGTKKEGYTFREERVFLSKIISELTFWIDHFDKQIVEQMPEVNEHEKHTSDLILKLIGIRIKN